MLKKLTPNRESNRASPTGTNYDRKVAAILDWDYCKTHKCEPPALEKLPLTRTRLLNFLMAISRPNTMGYTVMGPGVGPQSLRDFLEGPDGNWRIACVKKDQGPEASPTVMAEGTTRQYFAIRRTSMISNIRRKTLNSRRSSAPVLPSRKTTSPKIRHSASMVSPATLSVRRRSGSSPGSD